MKYFTSHFIVFFLLGSTALQAEVESIYTPLINEIIKEREPKGVQFSKIDSNALDVQCLETPERPYYVGIRLAMHINAPFSRVVDVVSRYEEYEKYFSTYKQIKVLEKGEKTFLTFWEQIVAVFFVPNVKFKLKHEVVQNDPKRIVSRYQMMEANLLDSVDGVTVIEDNGPRTKYLEFSFSETSAGILRSLGARPVWEDSLRSYYLSTLSTKLRAENPDWTYEQVMNEARLRFEKLDVDAILVKKGRLSQFR